MELKEIINLYGEIKKMSECILKDFFCNNKDMNIILFRYFNFIGVYKFGLIGEKL